MSLISNKNFILDEENEDNDIGNYTLPSLVTTKAEVIPLKKSVAGSVFLHVFTPALIWIISIILLLMGINLSLFNKIKDEYRFNLIVKNKLGENGHRTILRFLRSIKLPSDIKMVVDIDPSDIL